nr:DUF4199 domain-containing protein [Aquimarina algiphila]
MLGVSSVLFSVTLYLTGNIFGRSWLKALTSLSIFIGIIIYAIYSYKHKNNSFLKLREALKMGIGITFVAEIISIIWEILLRNVIEPDMTNHILQIQQDSMIQNNPDISMEKVHKKITTIKKHNALYILSMLSLINYLFVGFIISLVGGLVMSKKQNL